MEDASILSHREAGTRRPPLTLRAESGTGGELGHVHDLHRELLARLSVDASPHLAEGTPGDGGREEGV